MGLIATTSEGVQIDELGFFAVVISLLLAPVSAGPATMGPLVVVVIRHMDTIAKRRGEWQSPPKAGT